MSSIKLILILLFSTLIINGCLNPKYSQNPEHIFENGQLPTLIAEEVNPQPSQEDVIKVEQKRQQHQTLRIGVLDTGVDYLHPNLAQQMDYKLVNGEVVAIGKDVLGNDDFAHPNLFDPRLAAFGSKGLNKNHQIVEQNEDPLKLFDTINHVFNINLQKIIAEIPELKKSLFVKKINSDLQLSVLGARSLLKNKDDLLEKYQENFKEKNTVKNGSRSFNEITQFNLVKLKWTMSPENGLPRLHADDDLEELSDALTYAEGFDKFMAAVEQAYMETETKFSLEKNIQYLTEFSFSRVMSKKTSSREDSEEQVLKFLNKRWFHNKTGYMFSDPWAEYFFNFLQSLELSDLKQVYNTKITNQTAKKIISHSFKKNIRQIRKAYEYKLKNRSDKLTLRTERRYKAGIRLVNKIEKDFENELASRSLTDILNSLHKPSRRNTENASYQMLTLGKHLSSLGIEEVSHGTHVAGTIASENPFHLIHPIRVTTSQTAFSDDLHKEIFSSFVDGLKEWLTSHPRVLEVVLKKYGPVIDPEQEVNMAKEADRKQMITLIGRMAKDLILDEYADPQNKLNLLLNIDFVHQIDKAIQHIGDEKLKFVNVSLGTNGKRGLQHSDQANQNDVDVLQVDFFNFIQFEYFKFRLAKSIKIYTPQTVFFVAAGNDGIWFDSESKDVIPAGLNSPYLLADQAGQAFREISQYEYDVTNNIVVVASQGRDQSITPFTNLPIHEEANLVFGQGENILSAIKLSDLTGASAQFNKEFNKYGLELKINFNDPTDVQMLIDLKLLDPDKKNDPIFLKVAEAKLKKQIEFATQISGGPILRDFCLTSKICSSYYSGTSMASPNVAGKVGNKVQQLMEDLNISDGLELYTHPDFSVTAIQQLIKKTAPVLGGHTRFKHDKEISGPNKFVEMQRSSFNDLCVKALTK